MKNLKSVLTLHAAMTTTATVAAIAFMALPALASTREAISSQLRLSGELGLWVPVAAVVAIAHSLSYLLSVSKIARPFQKLATNATHCEQGFAFKTKSCSAEEDSIKHAIEANNLKTREAQQLAEELEGEVHDLSARLETAEAKNLKLDASNQEALKTASELRQSYENLKASKVAVDLTLENERKSKIGAEVEKRADEIYTQMERAVAASSLKSIWLPSFVQELKAPASVIKEITSALNGNCNNTPVSKIAAEIDLIRRQNESQISILEDILAKQPSELAAAKREVHDLEDNAQLESAERKTAEAEQAEAEQITEGTFEIAAEAEPEQSPCSLENILHGLIQEFTPLAPDSHITCSFDADLSIEIEDESLLALLHSLTEAAVALVENGEITLGVDLTTKHLTFDVACDGQLGLNLSPCLDTAKLHAEKLGGTIEVERCSSNELHFNFAYPLEQREPSQSI